MHNFPYSLTICLLHYYPRHVSSINMPIFRRKNCIHPASGSFAVCKRLHSTLVESGHYYPRHDSSINMPIFRRKNCIHTASGTFSLYKRLHSTLVECTVQTFTESEDTRCCVNKIFPPEDGHVNARIM